MTSIGCRCRHSNVHSRAILITQTLSGPQGPRDCPRRKAPRESNQLDKGHKPPALYHGKNTPAFSEVEDSSRPVLPPSQQVRQSAYSALFLTHTLRARQSRTCNRIKVAIASGLHLFPFRTEKLNLTTPMILRKWKSR